MVYSDYSKMTKCQKMAYIHKCLHGMEVQRLFDRLIEDEIEERFENVLELGGHDVFIEDIKPLNESFACMKHKFLEDIGIEIETYQFKDKPFMSPDGEQI